jgi:hypothetical protein
MHKQFLFLVSALALGSSACSSDKNGEGGNGGTGGGDVLATAGNGNINNGGPYLGGSQNLTPEQAESFRTSACAGWAASTEAQPAVLDFVVDTSLSMDEQAPGSNQSKWTVTQDALITAVDGLPEGMGVGLLLYPNLGIIGASDTPRDVSTCVNTGAMIGVDTLTPAHRTQITDAFANAGPDGSTPTHDAYRYALVNGLAPSTLPGQKFMLLITDGQPTFSLNCVGSGNPQDPVATQPIEDEIGGAFDALGIRTFIIGSPGSEANNPNGGGGADGRPWLSRAARLGGTATPGCSDDGNPYFCHMDMTEEPDFGAALNAGLAQIAGQIVSCNYPLPTPPAGESVDANAINVMFTDATGQAVLVLRSDDAACTEGWRYDGASNIVLCTDTCAQVQADARASLEVLGGCLTVTDPIF